MYYYFYLCYRNSTINSWVKRDEIFHLAEDVKHNGPIAFNSIILTTFYT